MNEYTSEAAIRRPYFVMNQAKDKAVNIDHVAMFTIRTLLGPIGGSESEDRYRVEAFMADADWEVQLGVYKDKEQALKILRELTEFFNSQWEDQLVYYMPHDRKKEE